MRQPSKPIAELAAAYTYCVRLLAMRQFSEYEMRSRLARRGASSDLINQTMEKLQQVKLLDDKQVATVVASGLRNKAKSRRVVTLELRKKGIAAPVASEALGESESDEQRLILAAEQITARYSSLPHEVAWRRAEGALLRRGFSPGAIGRILRTYGFQPYRQVGLSD